MLSAKRLIEMAKKWQNMVIGKRKRISYPRHEVDTNSSAVIKGHFVVYSVDHKRFVVHLKYLSTKVFRELFQWSEEVFGLPTKGPIMLPCDSVFLEYAISLVQERIDDDVEKALITFMYACHNEASSSCHDLKQKNQQIIIYGF
ncbi:auxin-responsive protein SAUR64-like [Cicer arietinum]|uniref:Auxin-responsive protein SAUR64-like n=1 Tax=Cicer arietinum TaxID=3827 RepID=A0A1S2YK78_CICAR|nr:auxin-responsive protein SAUR64-like [Cicer arietinum]